MLSIAQRLVLAFALLWQINGYATETDTATLNQLLANTQTMRADFTQAITDKTA